MLLTRTWGGKHHVGDKVHILTTLELNDYLWHIVILIAEFNEVLNSYVAIMNNIITEIDLRNVDSKELNHIIYIVKLKMILFINYMIFFYFYL